MKTLHRPQRSCGQGNIFAPVCHSVHRGGVCLSACWDTTPPKQTSAQQTTPPEQTPPTADTPPTAHPHWSRQPPEQTPPKEHTPWNRHPPEQTPPGSRLQHTVNERPVRILLEYILVEVSYFYFNAQQANVCV